MRSKIAILLGIFILSSVFNLGCGQSNTSGKAEEEITEAVQAGVEVLANLDEGGVQSGVSSVGLAPLDMPEGPRPGADLCSSVSFNACGTSAEKTRVKTFGGCTTTGGFTVTGTSTLLFSEASCLLPASGNPTITRTSDITLTGRRGGTLKINSGTHTDYRGNSIGGGQRLTRTGSNSFTFDVFGMHRVMTKSDGSAMFDISARTTSAVVGTGFVRSGRAISSGTWEVIHNLARYTATWTATGVTWTSSCACPTAGTISAIFSGTQTGTAAVTFSSTCGNVALTVNGSTTTVTLDSC